MRTATFIKRIMVALFKMNPSEMQDALFLAYSIFYFGRKFACPCCSGRLRKFLPHGVKPRSNAACPGCNSLERHRLLCLYLKERTNIFSGNFSILHVAPEYILQKKLRALPGIKYLSIDLESKLAMEKMDITRLTIPNNVFDVILASHVLEHVRDDRKAMSELYRVLKPGGWAIIQSRLEKKLHATFEFPDNATPEYRAYVSGSKNHFRVYGRDYRQKLEAIGFQVTVDDFAGKMAVELVKKYSIHSNEDIYLCRKKIHDF